MVKKTTAATQLPLGGEDWPVASIELAENPRISVGIYMLTPKVAQFWFDTHNAHNRGYVANRSATLAVDIDAGDWMLNGECIKFGIDPETGKPVLLDGQHRLGAVAQGEVAVPVGIWTGLAMISQETMDIGAKRTLGDILALRKVPNAVQVAALTSRIYHWEHGNIRNNEARARASQAQLIHKWERLPDLSNHISRGKACGARLHAPQSLFGLCSYVFEEVERNQPGGPSDESQPGVLVDVDHFFDRLADGRDLGERDPIGALRDMFLSNFKNKQKYGDTNLLALTIKGWNHYRDGNRVDHIVWRSGGKSPEAFPIPR